MRSRPFVLWLALLLAGCATSSDSAAPSFAGQAPETAIESGAELYTRYCASCHGLTGRGDGPAAETLRKPPSDLTRLGPRWGAPLDRPRLAAFVDGREGPRAHGTPEMPVWGEQLYAGDRPESPAREAARQGTILLIIEYLDTLQQAQ